jgi:molybdate transport system substrate-binding protein
VKLRTAALVVMILVSLGGCGAASDHGPANAARGDVTVFAASSLTQAFSKLGTIFERQHPGSKVQFNFAASDTLEAQIDQGAPADVFASAGPAPMQTVTGSSASSGKPRLFASNLLIIVTPPGNPVVQSPGDLAVPGTKLVLAAPGVPAGDYSREALKNLGIASAANKNLVSNEIDDKSVVSKVLLGNADAGIVYVTDLTPDVASKVAIVRIPKQDNVVAHYAIVALKNGTEQSLGRNFVDLVLSAKGQGILRGFGFGPP